MNLDVTTMTGNTGGDPVFPSSSSAASSERVDPALFALMIDAHQSDADATDAPAASESAGGLNIDAVLSSDSPASAGTTDNGNANDIVVTLSSAVGTARDALPTGVLDLPESAPDAAAATTTPPASAASDATPPAVSVDDVKHLGSKKPDAKNEDVLRRMIASLLEHSLLDGEHPLQISGEGHTGRFIRGDFPADLQIADDDPRSVKSHDDEEWIAEVVAELTAQLLAAQVKTDARNDPAAEKTDQQKADESHDQTDAGAAIGPLAAANVAAAVPVAAVPAAAAPVTAVADDSRADAMSQTAAVETALPIDPNEAADVPNQAGGASTSLAGTAGETANETATEGKGDHAAIAPPPHGPSDAAARVAALPASLRRVLSSLHDDKLQQLVQRALSRPVTPGSANAIAPVADDASASNTSHGTTVSAIAREIVHAVKSQIVKASHPVDTASTEIAKPKTPDGVAPNPEPATADSLQADAPATAATRVIVARETREVPAAAITFADVAPRLKGMPVSLPLPAAVAATARALAEFDTASGSGDQPGFGRGHESASSMSKRLAQVVESVTGFEAMLTTPTTQTGMMPMSSTSATPNIPNAPAVATSIVQSMRMQYRDGIGSAVITLDPEFLGGVGISIQVANGAVTATLQAENPQVRAWLEANEAMLRQGLEAQGLTLDRLVVAKEQPRDWNTPDEHRRQPHKPQEEKPRPRRTETATFEVIV